MAISTADLSLMPDIETLRKTLQAVAMLEAILDSRLGYRADHQFDAHWTPTEQLCHWDNQQGDNFIVVFSQAGCWFKGFAHEARMSPFRVDPPKLWPGMFRGLPAAFRKYLTELDFECDEQTTFCIWRRTKDNRWHRGRFALPRQRGRLDPAFRDQDQSGMLLSRFERTAEQWAEWENEHYELRKNPLDRQIVRRIFAHEPLRREWIDALDSRASVKKCRESAAKIGFPMCLDVG